MGVWMETLGSTPSMSGMAPLQELLESRETSFPFPSWMKFVVIVPLLLARLFGSIWWRNMFGKKSIIQFGL